MKIYTKAGDKGKTRLFTGIEIAKNHELLHAYGTIDELNSVLGIVICISKLKEIRSILIELQKKLINLCSDLATPIEDDQAQNVNKIKRFSENDIKYLEKSIDEFTEQLPELTHFILPGGSLTACYIHQSRTICRRAERHLTSCLDDIKINPFAFKFVNRLSDFLFTLARYANHKENVKDIIIE